MIKTIKYWQELYEKEELSMRELLCSGYKTLTKEQVMELLFWSGEQGTDAEEFIETLSLRTPKIYAVDFDGTLFLGAPYPEVGYPNHRLINFLIQKKMQGDKIILWTCRSGNYLKAAVKNANEYGLYFDAINENLVANIEEHNNNCRKVYADFYIDDKSITPEMAVFNLQSPAKQILKQILARFEEKCEQLGCDIIPIEQATEIVKDVIGPELLREKRNLNITFRGDDEYGAFPTLEEIIRDYEELVSLVSDATTLKTLQVLNDNYDLTISVNDMDLETYIKNEGTDEEITSIRYEAFGCLGYIYLKINQNNIDDIYVDVWSNELDKMFIEDSSIDNIKANYDLYIGFAKDR